MQNQVKVGFLSRRVQASDETIARRSSAVQQLENLGHLDAEVGELNTTEVRWFACIDGTELALLDFSVQKLDDGQVAVSLVAVVGAVSIGDPGPATDVLGDEASDDRRRLVVAGLEFAERATDPRADLPNWVPEQPLGAQVARNAKASS